MNQLCNLKSIFVKYLIKFINFMFTWIYIQLQHPLSIPIPVIVKYEYYKNFHYLDLSLVQYINHLHLFLNISYSI
jgi:hypothetical protein